MNYWHKKALPENVVYIVYGTGPPPLDDIPFGWYAERPRWEKTIWGLTRASFFSQMKVENAHPDRLA